MNSVSCTIGQLPYLKSCLRHVRRQHARRTRLYDLEYLTDPEGRRLAAFGYWAGYAGAAVSLKAYADQQNTKGICGPVSVFENKEVIRILI